MYSPGLTPKIGSIKLSELLTIFCITVNMVFTIFLYLIQNDWLIGKSDGRLQL